LIVQQNYFSDLYLAKILDLLAKSFCIVTRASDSEIDTLIADTLIAMISSRK